MKNKIIKNILLVLTGWFIIGCLTACNTSSHCYDSKNKEVKINKKEYEQYSRRHS